MIAVDTNILVYAHRMDSPFYEKAEKALRTLIEGSACWGLPWPCVHEFYSIITNPKIYKPYTTSDLALEQLEEMMISPSCRLLSEGSDYWSDLKQIIKDTQTLGPRIHDTRIAALCLSHGVKEIWSADRDFSRYKGFKVTNPLL